MSKYLFLLSVSLLLLVACTGEKSNQENSNQAEVGDTVANRIVDQLIAAHGTSQLLGRTLAFDFRGKSYTASRGADQYTYTRTWQDDSLGFVQDSLVNSSNFSRYINGSAVELSGEWQLRYGNSVNSVMYFMQLPLGLNDPAVIKEYLGTTSIKGILYHKIKVTFKQEGGGTDHDDVYCYWVNAETFTLDYLGYEFSVDGGGTRFREAINRQEIDGILFQDYINYKAEDKNTSILDHDALFEAGQLIELSRIENENIRLTDFR